MMMPTATQYAPRWGIFVAYEFRFDLVLVHWPLLLHGAINTLAITTASFALGLIVGLLGAIGRSYGPRPLSLALGAYVELIRNTPFLVQLFIVYFGLPAVGLRVDANIAALTAMTINVGAYAIEIIRAGLGSIARGQIEASTALGLQPSQTFLYVMLVPTMRNTFVALTSQFTLMLVTSSVISAVSAKDLTATTTEIASIGFRHLEAYMIATAIYLALGLSMSALFRRAFVRLFRYTP